MNPKLIITILLALMFAHSAMAQNSVESIEVAGEKITIRVTEPTCYFRNVPFKNPKQTGQTVSAKSYGITLGKETLIRINMEINEPKKINSINKHPVEFSEMDIIDIGDTLEIWYIYKYLKTDPILTMGKT